MSWRKVLGWIATYSLVIDEVVCRCDHLFDMWIHWYGSGPPHLP